MAFFKSRPTGEESASAPPQPESVELIRKRARYRLIGASVLVLLGVIGFPLVFDQQSRPVAVDIPIEIPDRQKVSPLASPVPVATPAAAPASASVVAAASAPALPSAAMANSTPLPPASAAVAPVARSAAVIDEKPAETQAKSGSQASKKGAPAAAGHADDGAKAQALLDGHAPPSVVEGRFVIQVGAFAEAGRAQEVRLKLERAGLKTYTHVADTKEGRRIRVRVGPFTAKSEADRVAEKVRRLDLPAAILTL
ncbi:MAG: SPOR domain-containing protein [Rhodoferax sp.]|nr:SPOR domain-containing protein [Rhodoferax sp.]